MRMLIIGYPMPDPAFDNYNVLTAPSYSDYDGLYVDPASITATVQAVMDEGKDFEGFDGRPVLNAPTSATVVSIADQLKRRADETRRLLDAGGIVIVAGRPNVTIGGVLGFEGADRYSWLPGPAGVAWGAPLLRAAEGKSLRIVREDHPAARVIRELRNEMQYRATFDDRQPAFAHAGARVIAAGGSGAPVAVEFPVLSGRVIFLPPFPEDIGSMRMRVADHVAVAARALLETSTPVPAPAWTRSFALPGLEQVEAEVEEAERASAGTAATLETARARLGVLANHRRMLCEEGTELAAATADALRVLGFVVESIDQGVLPVQSEGSRALVVSEGSAEAVVEWPYVRLQRKLEEHLLSQNEQLRGIIVVNGQRRTAPEERTERFSQPLRIACENYRYCLVTGETLFAMVQRALGSADEAALVGMRRRMLSTNGLLDTPVALGEVGQEKDSGPIF